MPSDRVEVNGHVTVNTSPTLGGIGAARGHTRSRSVPIDYNGLDGAVPNSQMSAQHTYTQDGVSRGASPVAYGHGYGYGYGYGHEYGVPSVHAQSPSPMPGMRGFGGYGSMGGGGGGGGMGMGLGIGMGMGGMGGMGMGVPERGTGEFGSFSSNRKMWGGNTGYGHGYGNGNGGYADGSNPSPGGYSGHHEYPYGGNAQTQGGWAHAGLSGWFGGGRVASPFYTPYGAR